MLAQQSEAMYFIVTLLCYQLSIYFAVGTPIGDGRLSDCSPIADKDPHSGGRWRELVLSLAAWNTCGLSAERLQYVLDDLKQDVTVLSELHGSHTSRARSQFVTCGDPESRDPYA